MLAGGSRAVVHVFLVFNRFVASCNRTLKNTHAAFTALQRLHVKRQTNTK